MNLVELFCSTQGRVGRGLYWSCIGIWALVSALLRGVVSLVASSSGDERMVAIAFWAWVGFSIVSFFPLLAIRIKRLHDTGRSGAWIVFQLGTLVSLLMLVASAARMSGGSLLWWLLMLFLFALGDLVVFVFTLVPGDDGSNEYGFAR